MGKINWLHISDLHFGHESEYMENCRNQLLEYLKKNEQNIDYLFITGDLIYANGLKDKENAYNDAFAYIRKIAEILWDKADDEVFRNKVFVVPGNHDVYRNKARESIIGTIQDEYQKDNDGKIEESLLKRCAEDLKDYDAFLKKMGQDEDWLSERRYHYVVKTEKLNILHLNTCVTSGKDAEDGTLIVGYDLLSKAVNDIDTALPTIALGHHSVECLRNEEQRKVEILLKQKNVILYLCGHSHERESNIILRYNQNKVLSSFTAGTLMAGENNNSLDIVILSGELDTEKMQGRIYSYKWNLENEWQKDMDFGLVQGKGCNYRVFGAGDPYEILSFLSFDGNERNKTKESMGEGVVSKIVSHTSPERSRAFDAVNERAMTALSVYGIGITHVSKNKELLEKILRNGGSVRLCMMDPNVLKSGICKSLVEEKKGTNYISIKIDKCDIDNLRFCIDASHMDTYIRSEYAEDVQKSYKRLLRLKEEFQKYKDKIEIKVLKSFVPISLNIVNEDNEENTELIAEYNMPFVTKRLLIHLYKKQNSTYYEEMKNVYDKIWTEAEEV